MVVLQPFLVVADLPRALILSVVQPGSERLDALQPVPLAPLSEGRPLVSITVAPRTLFGEP